MARIRVPTPFKKLMDEVSPQEFVPFLSKYKAIDPQGNYLHWDKFKWKVTKGDSEDAAWVATKLSRKTITKYIPKLTGKNEGEIFSYCVPDSLFSQLHYIDKLTGGGHSIGDGSFITAREKDRYLVKNLMMEEAITSSQLEGASTTRKVAKDMLENNRKPADKSEQMIFNNFLLMKKVVERKDEDLSIGLMLELHAIATFEAIDNDAVSGELREDNEITVRNNYNEIAHEPPCHETLKERLTDLCDFANECSDGQNSDSFIHPLIKAIILHFMIGYIHPFGDGNGRTARAIFYWFMLRSGYWLFEYVSISKLIQEKRSDYDTAYVYTESDELDLTYFIYHQADIVTKAVDALQNHIESKKSEFYQFMEWIEKSPLSKKLKRAQLELLKDAIKEPGKIFTSKQVSADFDINEGTARTYLNGLVEEDLLMSTRSKKGKMILYLAPQGLRDKLKI
jgi:Fic family protein